MLRTTKNMRDKYENIQNYLFELIPEKWDEIYLYASVVDRPGEVQSGEMFFYYLPKGLLKKKEVNVYEVPKRFNINETEYLKIVDLLYQEIKDLRQDFKDTEQDLWTNLTISISHGRFTVEYRYEEISQEEYLSFERHVIWRYKYLHIGGEQKEEKKILQKYFENQSKIDERKEEYQTGIYLKTANNVVRYEREIEDAKKRKIEQEQRAQDLEEKRTKKREEKAKKEEEKRLKEEANNKNQILKM